MFQNVSKSLWDLSPDMFTRTFVTDVVKFLDSPQVPPLFYVVTKFSIFRTIYAYFIKSTNLTELGLLQNNVRFSPDHYFPSSRCWFSCFLGTNEFWQTPPSPLNTRCIFVTSYVHLSPLSSSLQLCSSPHSSTQYVDVHVTYIFSLAYVYATAPTESVWYHDSLFTELQVQHWHSEYLFLPHSSSNF